MKAGRRVIADWRGFPEGSDGGSSSARARYFVFAKFGRGSGLSELVAGLGCSGRRGASRSGDRRSGWARYLRGILRCWRRGARRPPVDLGPQPCPEGLEVAPSKVWGLAGLAQRKEAGGKVDEEGRNTLERVSNAGLERSGVAYLVVGGHWPGAPRAAGSRRARRLKRRIGVKEAEEEAASTIRGGASHPAGLIMRI